MRRVLYSLAPIFLYSIWLYGWRPVAIMAVSVILGTLTEWAFERTRKKKVSEAVLVTAALFGMAMPPATPLWVVAVGIIFATAMGKGVYGGFGRNIFNPAITGRLFVYISFPLLVQSTWMVPGGFGTRGINGVDGVSTATPLEILGGASGTGSNELLDLFFGMRVGSIGESAIFLILAAAVYLIWTKTANWRMIVSSFLAGTLATVGFYAFGLIDGMSPAGLGIAGHTSNVLSYLMSGSFMYIVVFMTTDPVSAPNKPLAQWMYGILIGSVSMLIRTFSGFPEGTSFAILIGNTFASLLDEISPAPKKKQKKAKPATSGKTDAQAGNKAGSKEAVA